MAKPTTDEFTLPPGMEGTTWVWDSMHIPRALPPLAVEVTQEWFRVMSGGGFRTPFINGYGYIPAAAGLDVLAATPVGTATAGAAWEDFYLPQVRDIVVELSGGGYEALPAGELAAALPALMERSAQAFRLTMAAIGPLMGQVMPFAGFCMQHFGAAGMARSLELVQGVENETTAAGRGLEHLAALAARSPGIVAAAGTGDLDAVAAAPGGRAFLEAFRAYLDQYGQGTQTWFELHEPTWAEDPTVPLRMVARLASGRGTAVERAHQQSAERREAAITTAEAELGDPGVVAQFRQLRAAALDYVSVIEGRAHWQLRAFGVLRIPCLALGRKLAAAGALRESDDVFYLSTAELQAAAGDGATAMQPTVDRNRADVRRWRQLTPPATLGKPLDAAAAANPMMAMLFGPQAADGGDRSLVRGIGASRGVVRGRAVVVLDLGDAERLQEGDVLVCPFTAPPWTPLFAIAAAVVTDAGGALSHAAIAAREYAIPCVVGTRRGTTAIPDGAMVTVDGAEGTVRIED